MLTKMDRRSFRFAAPTVWNSLPIHLRENFDQGRKPTFESQLINEACPLRNIWSANQLTHLLWVYGRPFEIRHQFLSPVITFLSENSAVLKNLMSISSSLTNIILQKLIWWCLNHSEMCINIFLLTSVLEVATGHRVTARNLSMDKSSKCANWVPRKICWSASQNSHGNCSYSRKTDGYQPCPGSAGSIFSKYIKLSWAQNLKEIYENERSA